MGSIEGVQKAKGKLVEAIPVDGLVVLNADDPLVLALAGRARGRVTTFGEGPDSDLRLGPVRVTEGGLAFPSPRAGRPSRFAYRWPAATTPGTPPRRPAWPFTWGSR